MRKASIAVYTPGCVTGGVEALHQMAAALAELGHRVRLHYYETTDANQIRPEYAHYGGQVAVDHDDDYEWAIVPEIRRDLIAPLHQAGKRVAFWHLGVGSWPTDDVPDLHLACGTHAEAWVRQHGVTPLAASDYIGRNFFRTVRAEMRHKEILYGWRGIDKIDALRNLLPYARFRLIRNLPAPDVAAELSRAAVFLEAGGSGGRDRMPREAALCGAAVVWYKTDPQFGVPDWDRTDTFDACARRLRDVLNAPETAVAGQRAYRQWIEDAEQRFYVEVAALSNDYLTELSA